MINITRWSLALVLGLFLIAFGVMKFTGAHIFQYIAFKSGIDLFHPLVNHVVGVSELIAGALLILPRTRHFGAVLALGVIGGAIVFHLSPWLGVLTPGGFAAGAAAPWDAADFSSDLSPALFIIAVVMFTIAAANAFFERERILGLIGRAAPAAQRA